MNYKILSENFEMKCTPEKLMNDLVECYTAFSKNAAEHGDYPDYSNDAVKETLFLKAYNRGFDHGAVGALSAIMLSVFGGKQMYEIWEQTTKWVSEEMESED